MWLASDDNKLVNLDNCLTLKPVYDEGLKRWFLKNLESFGAVNIQGYDTEAACLVDLDRIRKALTLVKQPGVLLLGDQK